MEAGRIVNVRAQVQVWGDGKDKGKGRWTIKTDKVCKLINEFFLN
jgi:hypothetical protein